MLSHKRGRIYAAVLTVYMLLTVEVQVQSQCSTKSDTEAGFTPSTSVYPFQIYYKNDTSFIMRRWQHARRVRLKPDGTRAETRFGLSPKRTSPFKKAGASVQSIAGSRGVCITVSIAGYTTFRGSVRVLATHSIR